jgi:Outer membrane protein and related peptidoglycan-associated (lipo)proteins
VGTEDYNQRLSEDRAHSVTTYLISKGIAKDRLRAVGFGTRRPLADNETDEGRAKNRRVELIPFEKEGKNDAGFSDKMEESVEKPAPAAAPAAPAKPAEKAAPAPAEKKAPATAPAEKPAPAAAPTEKPAPAAKP